MLTMQDVEHAREVSGAHRIQQRRNAIDAVRIHTARAQRLQHIAPRIQRHRALGRGAAHHHRDAAEGTRVIDMLHVLPSSSSVPARASAVAA